MSAHNTWPHQLYRFASFLYWEPQHINRQKRRSGDYQSYERAMEKLRRIEVPLNVLFNMMLRLSPQRIKQRILNCFVPTTAAQFGQQLTYINIYDHLEGGNIDFIQPDAVLASDQARICVELKIDAALSLNQVYKYLALLELWQSTSETTKSPYLLFLTKKSLRKQWQSKERALIFTEPNDLNCLQRYLEANKPPQKLKWMSSPTDAQEMIEQATKQVQLGWASWQMVGDVLHNELDAVDQANLSDDAEMLQTLLGDFLTELDHRGLWETNT